MPDYQALLRLAFPDPARAPRYLTPATLGAQAAFERAALPEQPYRFELWRLGVALSLLRLLGELGDHDEARRAADVLHRAQNTARSPREIDDQIGREAKLFDQIYTNLYVNDQGEALLDLFARTLDADAPARLAETQAEALALARTLDFGRDEEAD